MFGVLKVSISRDKLIKVEANPKRGFTYGYYLYIPNGAKNSQIKYMLVEPNNTGKPSDVSTIHEEEAKKINP